MISQRECCRLLQGQKRYIPESLTTFALQFVIYFCFLCERHLLLYLFIHSFVLFLLFAMSATAASEFAKQPSEPITSDSETELQKQTREKIYRMDQYT